MLKTRSTANSRYTSISSHGRVISAAHSAVMRMFEYLPYMHDPTIASEKIPETTGMVPIPARSSIRAHSNTASGITSVAANAKTGYPYFSGARKMNARSPSSSGKLTRRHLSILHLHSDQNSSDSTAMQKQ